MEICNICYAQNLPTTKVCLCCGSSLAEISGTNLQALPIGTSIGNKKYRIIKQLGSS